MSSPAVPAKTAKGGIVIPLLIPRKDLETHKLAVALHFGVYNFVRKHKTLGTTPAVAAGVEFERWSLERVVEMTANYLRRKEDAKFEKAFAKLEKL